MQVINRSIVRLAVTGGREYKDKNRVYKELDDYRKVHIGVTTIVVGDGRGTDQWAREYAQEKKLILDVKKADWTDMSEPCVKKIGNGGRAYNALAGFKRNQFVVNDADALLSFWNKKSPGTKDCMKKADDKGIKVTTIIVQY